MIIIGSSLRSWLKSLAQCLFSETNYGEGVREVRLLWIAVWIDPNLVSRRKPERIVDPTFSPYGVTFCWKRRREP